MHESKAVIYDAVFEWFQRSKPHEYITKITSKLSWFILMIWAIKWVSMCQNWRLSSGIISHALR